jgi:hypothetical protein
VVHFAPEYSRFTWKLCCELFIGSGTMSGISNLDLGHFQDLTKILFDHFDKGKIFKFSPGNFMFMEGIKKPVIAFYTLR